jgi:hemerythrin-like domain-containing protein
MVGEHFKKEEHILFPELVTLGVSIDHGPIGVLLKDHRMMEAAIDHLQELLLDAMEGNGTVKNLILFQVEELVRMKQRHLENEELVLYKIAQHHIPETRLLRLEQLISSQTESITSHGEMESMPQRLCG